MSNPQRRKMEFERFVLKVANEQTDDLYRDMPDQDVAYGEIGAYLSGNSIMGMTFYRILEIAGVEYNLEDLESAYSELWSQNITGTE